MRQHIDYLVTLEVYSTKHSLNDLNDLIGIAGDGVSLNIGDTGPRGVREYTIWRLTSDLVQHKTSLSDHVTSLFARIPPERVAMLNSKISDIEAVLNIGVLYPDSNMTCTIRLPYSVVQLCNRSSIGVEITTYPCRREGEALIGP
jgi:hypothetical protein